MLEARGSYEEPKKKHHRKKMSFGTDGGLGKQLQQEDRRQRVQHHNSRRKLLERLWVVFTTGRHDGFTDILHALGRRTNVTFTYM